MFKFEIDDKGKLTYLNDGTDQFTQRKQIDENRLPIFAICGNQMLDIPISDKKNPSSIAIRRDSLTSTVPTKENVNVQGIRT